MDCQNYACMPMEATLFSNGWLAEEVLACLPLYDV